jgi:hypothetical protein
MSESDDSGAQFPSEAWIRARQRELTDEEEYSYVSN